MEIFSNLSRVLRGVLLTWEDVGYFKSIGNALKKKKKPLKTLTKLIVGRVNLILENVIYRRSMQNTQKSRETGEGCSGLRVLDLCMY